MTASGDKLRQQAVRVLGTAVCGLPSSMLLSCSHACPPSASLPLPLPYPPTPSLYLINVDLGAAVLCGGTLLVSSLILLPLIQKEKWLPVVRHLPLKPGERRGGKRALCTPICLCGSEHSVISLEMPLNCCQIPLSAVQMEFSALRN